MGAEFWLTGIDNVNIQNLYWIRTGINSVVFLSISASSHQNYGFNTNLSYFLHLIFHRFKPGRMMGTERNGIESVTVNLSDSQNYGFDINIGFLNYFRIFWGMASRVSLFISVTPKTMASTLIQIVLDYFFYISPLFTLSLFTLHVDEDWTYTNSIRSVSICKSDLENCYFETLLLLMI